MKISKAKLRRIIMEELNEARSKRLRPQDPSAWEEEKIIVKGAPYPDDEALELFDKVSRLYGPDKPHIAGADDVNAFFEKRAKHLEKLEVEYTADLPKIIWSYGGEPNRGEPSLEQLQQMLDASENDYPDPRYYDEEIDTKSGIKYWRRKDKFDARTGAYPLKTGLGPSGAGAVEELRDLYPGLISQLGNGVKLVDKYVADGLDPASALLKALEDKAPRV